MKKIISMLFAVAMVFGFISNANAAKTLKCQTVLNTKADEVKMLKDFTDTVTTLTGCLLYTSPSPRDRQKSRMPSSA